MRIFELSAQIVGAENLWSILQAMMGLPELLNLGFNAMSALFAAASFILAFIVTRRGGGNGGC
jgi:hypothetical protein